MKRTRKSALALAGAVAGTLTAASVAGAVNLGLLSSESSPSDDPSELFVPSETTDTGLEDPTTSTSVTQPDDVEVVIEDVYDLPPAGSTGASGSAPGGTIATAPSSAPAATTPVVPPTSVRHDDDDDHDDDHDDDRDDDHDDDRDHDDDHDDDHDEDEHEGEDDDD